MEETLGDSFSPLMTGDGGRQCGMVGMLARREMQGHQGWWAGTSLEQLLGGGSGKAEEEDRIPGCC